jgi:very-short-patch-repair endonuclease
MCRLCFPVGTRVRSNPPGWCTWVRDRGKRLSLRSQTCRSPPPLHRHEPDPLVAGTYLFYKCFKNMSRGIFVFFCRRPLSGRPRLRRERGAGGGDFFLNRCDGIRCLARLICKAREDTTTVRARALRKADNPAERALWAVLKNRQLAGHTFTRQFPIGPYVADFACRARNVVVEVDGSQHLERAACDRTRDEYMLRAGYAVFRVPSVSVLSNRDGVCDSLLAVLEGRIEDEVEAPRLRPIPIIHSR